MDSGEAETQMRCQVLVRCVAEIPIKEGSHNKTSDNRRTARKVRKPCFVGNKGNNCTVCNHILKETPAQANIWINVSQFII